MPIQLIVALLRNEDGQWIEPTCMCYQRQLVDFVPCADSFEFLQGTCVFQCYRAPGEDPGLHWDVTHVGIVPFAGTGNPLIVPLGLNTNIIKHGMDVKPSIRLPASFADVSIPLRDPALRYA